MAEKKTAKLKSKLGCISSLFTCFNPSKNRSKKGKKNASDNNDGVVDKNHTKVEQPLKKRPISPPNIGSIGSCGSVTSARSSVFFETNEGTDEQWFQDEIDSFDSFAKHEIDGQFFFSAKDDPKISQETFEGIHLYPPIPTIDVDPVLKSVVSTSNMETLLRSYQYGEEDVQQSKQNKEATEMAGLALEHQAQRLMSMTDKQDANDIFNSTSVLLEELKKGIVSEKGFPGALTEEELDAVKRFKSELESKDPVYTEIVRSFKVVEKEAYSLCRWLRARKFDVDAVFELLNDAKEHYEKAKKHDFYPNLEDSLGFSRDIFLSQYPEIYSGNARNGCPVMYMRLGSVQPEGIKCLLSIEDAEQIFWNAMKHSYTDRLEEGRRINPAFVRTENMTIYDFKGVSRSQINADTIDMIKVAAKVMNSFPETLHCLLIVNAPSWFGLAWAVVRKVIDARTASKIEVFTSSKKGIARMRDLIDDSQIPSDYGGTGPSLAQAAAGVSATTGSNGASKPQDSSKVVVLNKVLHLNKHQEKRKDFELKEGETMTVTIYTRCKTGATAAIVCEGSESPMIEKDVVGKDDDTPYSMVLGEVRGPGKFDVRLKSISSPGVFLILGKM